MRKKLYLLRHCKTLFNEENIVSGQIDCPLIDYSLDFSVLEKEECDNPYILIFSPLKRCVLTAKTLQIQSKLNISSFMDSRLVERNMGLLEGKKRSNLVKDFPNYFCNGHFKDYMTPPLGESYHDFEIRIASFASSIEHLLSENNVIICSHNQTLRMLTAIITNREYTDIPKYSNGIVKEMFFD